MKREISIVASAWALFPFETPSAKPGLVHFHLTCKRRFLLAELGNPFS